MEKTADDQVTAGHRSNSVGLAATADPERIEAPVTWKAYLMCAFASFGGIFFGYDSGYINGVNGSPDYVVFADHPEVASEGAYVIIGGIATLTTVFTRLSATLERAKGPIIHDCLSPLSWNFLRCPHRW